MQGKKASKKEGVNRSCRCGTKKGSQKNSYKKPDMHGTNRFLRESKTRGGGGKKKKKNKKSNRECQKVAKRHTEKKSGDEGREPLFQG